MEEILETPQAEAIAFRENKVPKVLLPNNQNSPSSAGVACTTMTPEHLKVPLPFKYPERYTSPTDLMMSPVSRGLLAKSRKANAFLPPSSNQSKV